LTDSAPLKKWERLDSDIRLHFVSARRAGVALVEEVRKYHIPDFSNWNNHDAFEPAFARLGKDLRRHRNPRFFAVTFWRDV
jgi:hypothetical protein